MLKRLPQNIRDGHTVVEAFVLHAAQERQLVRWEQNWHSDAEELPHADACQIAHGLVIRDVKEKQCTVLIGDLALVYSRPGEMQTLRKGLSPAKQLLLQDRVFRFGSPWRQSSIQMLYVSS